MNNLSLRTGLFFAGTLGSLLAGDNTAAIVLVMLAIAELAKRKSQ